MFSRVGLVAVLLISCSSAWAQQIDERLYQGLEWRELGPWRGGRSCAVSGVEGRSNEFYMGATGGGVWKTTDSGENWKNVSDGFFGTGSIGAIAVAPSSPDIIYVGTGETQIRGNITHGDGMYKSTDAGKTWKRIGLEKTKYISRVRVHPTDANTLWVAALGPVFGASSERGIYKSTDGGSTWKKTLYVSEIAGGADISFAPSDPRTIYASTWEAWRRPWTLNSGGPGSRLFKSTDGGDTWTNISASQGLPIGLLGKIGVAVSPVNPNRVWAMVEAENGGLFRSDDAGKTWTLITDRRDFRQRAWYYTRIYADPNDAERMYVLNVSMFTTADGGKSFQGVGTPHSDNHDLWIDPKDSNRMVNANDGGGNVTLDRGKTWTEQDILTAQIYHVNVDNAFPYNVLGAQQDNSTLRIPSRTRGQGISSEDWTTTAGAESGYVTPKPDNPDIVFGGNYGGLLEWFNHRLQQSRDVSPWPDNPMGSGADVLTERFQWTFPIVFSPHDPNVIYASSQHLFRSENMGQSWDRISPDLTRNDKAKQASSGGPITKDNTSVEYYGTIFTLSESPITKGMIWTGSDDGLIHLTRDGGRTWKNVTPKQMPDFGRVSIVEASPHNPEKCLVAVNNYQQDDDKPYLFVTEDGGASWKTIVNGIPTDQFTRVIREDPLRPKLLYAGTEKGVWVSFDNGANWKPLQLNLPNVPVHDLVIKDADIVIATHGRGFWILDDMGLMRQLDGAEATRPTLFRPTPAVKANGGGQPAPNASAARNPLNGAIVRYYLPAEKSGLKVELIDSSGKAFMSVNATGKVGLNTVALTPRYPSFQQANEFRMWGAFPQPIPAPPGFYKVRLFGDGIDVVTELDWRKNPLTTATNAELMEQFTFARKISAKTHEIHSAIRLLREKREAVLATKQPGAEALAAKLTAIEEVLCQPRIQSGQDPLNYPIKLNNKIAALLGVVLSYDAGPTRQSLQVYESLSKQADDEMAKLNRLLRDEVEPFLKA